MTYVTTRLGAILAPERMMRSCWAVKLSDDTFLSELDTKFDLRVAGRRQFDWALDLCDTGDILKVTSLWLFGPPSPAFPAGQTRFLTIEEPGTAFQFKVANVDVMGAWGKTTINQIIGKVTDKESGACTCWIWDGVRQQIQEYQSSIYHFGSWRREGPSQVAEIGALSHEVMGFRLGMLSSYSPHNPI